MKRAAALLMAVILSLALTAPAVSAAPGGKKPDADSIRGFRDIPGITGEEISAIEALIEQRGGFTYGHLLETEAFMLPDGTYAGFTIEFCKLLTDLFGVEFTPECYGVWTEMKSALDKRELDFSGGFTWVEELRGTYYMTVPIAGRDLKLYSLKSKAIESAEGLDGKRIGAIVGSVVFDTVNERYPGYYFDRADFSTYEEGVAMLEAGKIDAIIATSAADPRLSIYDSITSKDFFALAYYPVSITTADEELTPIISALDKYIEAGGSERVFTLYREGEYAYKRNRLFQSFTGAEIDYLNEMLSSGRKVDIGFQHDAYPASFYNDVENEFQGVSIDVLKEITRLTGLEFAPLSTSETTTLATILEKLKTGEISMMTQLLKTESRKNDYIWSSVPYLTTNYALLSKIDYPNAEVYQVPRERVGTVYKSAHEAMFETWFPNAKSRTVYDTTNEGFIALEDGEIDLLMLSENMLLQQTNLRQKTGFKVNVKFDVSLDSFFGFSKREHILRSIVDKSMAFIDVDGIAGGWMNRVFDYKNEVARVRSMYLMYLTTIMFAALISVLALLVKNKRLGKSIMEYTATLSTIYKSIPDTVFSKNAEGIYTSCNPSFERQAGLPESEIIGKTYGEVFKDRVEKTIEQYKEIDRDIMTGRKTSLIEEEVVYPDGSRRLLETLKAPLVQNDTVVGIIGMGRDITERKEIKSRLDRIINTAQVAFILTIDGIITEANQYCKDYVGMKVGDDIRPFYANPGQRGEVLALVERYGTISNTVIHIRFQNGEVHRFLTSITLTEYEQRKAHIIWALDIEKDERRRDLLRETQLSFQTVLDTLPMPVRIVDLESRKILYVNSSLLELLEYDSPDELCGRSIDEIVPEFLSDATPSAEREEALIAESPHTVAVDMEYLTRSGRIIDASVVARVIDYMGKRSSIGIIKDLTEEKKTAQMLRDSAEREKEANQAKSSFLANMSHEIRTPMNGIIGMTDLLTNEHLTERQRQYAKDIKLSAESLLNIINDILDLSKITEGKLQIMPVDIDLNMMLKNVVSMMRFSAQSKGLSFIDDIHIGAPEYVRVDDVRLNQIIINLLSNAIKFTQKGYVKLTVKIEGDSISIKVSDTGTGIKKDELSLIFSAFEQADKRKNRAIRGTGLGLSITKNLVGLMGGEIYVESEYGAGSEFYVTIPYVPGDESAVETTETKFEYIFAPTAQVLLVDDIQTNLTVGAGLLRLCGIMADVAISGREALEHVKSTDYDAVFMDHMMPDMDGVETMRAIRALGGKYADLPIIALTANAVGEARSLLLASGMDDFLSKPIDKTELMAILKKWLPPEKIKSVSKSSEFVGNIQYSESLLAASNIEGLDVDLALSRIGGLHDVLEKSIRQVAFSIDENLRRMDDCLAKGDLKGVASHAHGLKGALANIGATKYSELASVLEIGAKAENMPLCIEKFTLFASVIRQFASQLKIIYRAAVPDEKPVGDIAFLTALVKRAMDCLDRFEADDALDCLNEADGFTFGEELDGILSEAISAAGRYKYSMAVSLLAKCLSICKDA